MILEPFRAFTAPTLVLPRDGVDTDQIIPARFLTATTRGNLADALFADWRFDAEGRPRPDCIFNRPEARAAGTLVVGRDFGCGSSREHAVWALSDFGFRAVVGVSFADIFRNNAGRSGLLAAVVDAETQARLVRSAGAALSLDLEAQVVTLADGTRAAFCVEPFARRCLLDGLDALGCLLSQEPAIAAYEAGRSEL